MHKRRGEGLFVARLTSERTSDIQETMAELCDKVNTEFW